MLVGCARTTLRGLKTKKFWLLNQKILLFNPLKVVTTPPKHYLWILNFCFQKSTMLKRDSRFLGVFLIKKNNFKFFIIYIDRCWWGVREQL